MALAGLSTPNLNGGDAPPIPSPTSPSIPSSSSPSSSHDSKANDSYHSAETELHTNNANSPAKSISVFDIALDLEDKLRKLNQNIQQHDDEVNKRLDKLVTRIRTLEKKLKN